MRLAAPVLPFCLGLSGLLPFWFLALGRVTGIGLGFSPGGISLALAVYGATIVSFLGGIRWGLALGQENQRQARTDYLVSVLPQLAGWTTLALPDPWRLLALAGLVLVLGPIDRSLVRRGLAPAWFGRLRIMLSVGAGAALFLAGLA